MSFWAIEEFKNGAHEEVAYFDGIIGFGWEEDNIPVTLDQWVALEGPNKGITYMVEQAMEEAGLQVDTHYVEWIENSNAEEVAAL